MMLTTAANDVRANLFTLLVHMYAVVFTQLRIGNVIILLLSLVWCEIHVSIIITCRNQFKLPPQIWFTLVCLGTTSYTTPRTLFNAQCNVIIFVKQEGKEMSMTEEKSGIEHWNTFGGWRNFDNPKSHFIHIVCPTESKKAISIIPRNRNCCSKLYLCKYITLKHFTKYSNSPTLPLFANFSPYCSKYRICCVYWVASRAYPASIGNWACAITWRVCACGRGRQMMCHQCIEWRALLLRFRVRSEQHPDWGVRSSRETLRGSHLSWWVPSFPTLFPCVVN